MHKQKDAWEEDMADEKRLYASWEAMISALKNEIQEKNWEIDMHKKNSLSGQNQVD